MHTTQNHTSLLQRVSNMDFPDVIKFHVAVHTTQNHASLLRRAPDTHVPGVIKFCVAVHMLWKKAIRARKLISSSMSRHLSTLKMSSKSMHAFLSNLANKQRQTSRAIAITSSVVGGKLKEIDKFLVQWGRWKPGCLLPEYNRPWNPSARTLYTVWLSVH